jgi:Ca2+/H+ antiporter
LTAPEGSDSDSSSDSNGTSDNESIDGDDYDNAAVERRDDTEGDGHGIIESSHTDICGETTPLINTVNSSTKPLSHRRRRDLKYHVFYLLFGFFAICLAGYVLSHAASSIVDEFKMSDVLFGIVILAIATTLPEKFIAVLSGHRGYTGVLVANTAGSNIFLLTLCAGIVLLDTKGSFQNGSVGVLELGVLWGSTVAFTATIWVGARYCRWIGGLMMVGYIAFVVLEFAVVAPRNGVHNDHVA